MFSNARNHSLAKDMRLKITANQALLRSMLLSMPKRVKQVLAMLVDATMCSLTIWIAFWLRLGDWITLENYVVIASLLSVVLALPIFWLMGLYRVVFRHGSILVYQKISQAVVLYCSLYTLILIIFLIENIPRSIAVIQTFFLLTLVLMSRYFAQRWLGNFSKASIDSNPRVSRLLIYGAGAGGRQLASILRNSKKNHLVGFLDDSPSLQGRHTDGLKIYAPRELNSLITSLNVNEVIIAIPSLTKNRLEEILKAIKVFNIKAKATPSIDELLLDKLKISDFLNLEPASLLTRDQVLPETRLLQKNIKGKTVVVTGAGGSIGSELCRQIINFSPCCLLLIDHSEHALYSIHQELEDLNRTGFESIPLLGSADDRGFIALVMSRWSPDTVYHAAAYKHVPIVENNIIVGTKNNVFGTLKLAEAALKYGVKTFVLISSDKAVRPTNVMGATKRLAEMIVQGLSGCDSKTNFSIVRFGNVLGSSGSVIPRFKSQIDRGGPVTVTHLEVTRFFMTVAEAAQLVIQAGGMAKGGEVFLLDMGKPVKVFELAKNIIEISGLKIKDKNNPDGDIEILVTGLRPGEKLYEELLIGENPKKTSHRKILKAREERVIWKDLSHVLKRLEKAIENQEVKEVLDILEGSVTGYSISDTALCSGSVVSKKAPLE